MKKSFRQAVIFAVAVLISYGCASSDTTMDYEGIATESPIADQNEITSNAGMDSTEGARISAGNELGRDMNIVALVQQNPDLSTFLELIRAADLVVNLQNPATYTVFAPSNKAFAALPAGTLEMLKAPSNKLELTRIIQAHVLPTKMETAALQNSAFVTTAQGDEIKVTKNGNALLVGGATIQTPNVQASNGVVHVIDKVLVPPKNGTN